MFGVVQPQGREWLDDLMFVSVNMIIDTHLLKVKEKAMIHLTFYNTFLVWLEAKCF